MVTRIYSRMPLCLVLLGMSVAMQVPLCALPTRGKTSAPSTRQATRRSAEYERLSLMLEEYNPSLHQQFVTHAGRVMTRTGLKGSDKKAVQSFLKAVAADADVHPADKKAIQQFFKSGLSTGAKIGIGVGSAVALAALAVIAARNGISRSMRGALGAVGRADGDARGVVPPLTSPHLGGGAGGSGSLTAGARAGSGDVTAIASPHLGASRMLGAGAPAGAGAGSATGGRGEATTAGAMAGAGAGGVGVDSVMSGASSERQNVLVYFGGNVAPRPVSYQVSQGTLWIDHAKNKKERADQDACLVDVLPNGDLRICVCDGTGESPIGQVFNDGSIEDFGADDQSRLDIIRIEQGQAEASGDPERYLKYGGAAAATFIVDRVKGLGRAPTVDDFARISRDMHAITDPVRALMLSAVRGSYPAREAFFNQRHNPLLGGSSTITSVVLSADGRRVTWSNLGDSGAFILTADGKMMHGPSLHVNLEGFNHKDGTTAMGYSDSKGQSEDVESFSNDVPANAQYLIVACDGLIDKVRGPRRVIRSGDATEYQSREKSRDRPSINTDKLYSQDDIDRMWRDAKATREAQDTPPWLKLEYEDCKGGFPPITVDLLLQTLNQAKESGTNLSQVLVQLAQKYGSSDDITVVVIDLRPLRSHRAHSGEAYPATESVAGAGAGAPAGAGTGSATGGLGNTSTAGER